MSNKRKTRQLNGGRLTRPRGDWVSRPRGPARSPRSAEMSVSASLAVRSIWLNTVGLPRRGRMP